MFATYHRARTLGRALRDWLAALGLGVLIALAVCGLDALLVGWLR